MTGVLGVTKGIIWAVGEHEWLKKTEKNISWWEKEVGRGRGGGGAERREEEKGGGKGEMKREGERERGRGEETERGTEKGVSTAYN